MRLIDANAVVKAILEERDKIPRTIATAPYEPWAEKPYHAGDQMRGGIRKALRCIEQSPTVDAMVITRCKDCRYRGLICCPAIHETMGNGLVDYAVDNGYCWCGKPKET